MHLMLKRAGGLFGTTRAFMESWRLNSEPFPEQNSFLIGTHDAGLGTDRSYQSNVW